MSSSPLALKVLAQGYSFGFVAAAVIGVVRYVRIDRTRQMLVGWLVIGAMGCVAEQLTRVLFQNTQIVAQLWYPASGAAALWIAAANVGGAVAQRSLRAAALVYLFLMVGLLLVVEEAGTHSRIAGAVHGIILLATGGGLVLLRARDAQGDMWRDAGFLTGAGLMLIGAPSAFLALTSRAISGADREIVRTLFGIRLLLASAGLVLLIRALTLPDNDLATSRRVAA